MEGAAGGTKDAVEYVDATLFFDGDVAAAVEQATIASSTSLAVKFISLSQMFDISPVPASTVQLPVMK